MFLDAANEPDRQQLALAWALDVGRVLNGGTATSRTSGTALATAMANAQQPHDVVALRSLASPALARLSAVLAAVARLLQGTVATWPCAKTPCAKTLRRGWSVRPDDIGADVRLLVVEALGAILRAVDGRALAAADPTGSQVYLRALADRSVRAYQLRLTTVTIA